MLAGLLVPERPVGNMYFAAWSHNVISNTVNLSNDLKMGEYRKYSQKRKKLLVQPLTDSAVKIPPRVMFLTQCWGTIFGGFISYVLMVSIVTQNADVLTNSDGNASWSGATMQSYNTNATAWAMAAYLYKAGQTYFLVPVGIAVGAALVVAHRIFAHVCLHPLRSILETFEPQLTTASVRAEHPWRCHFRSQLASAHPVRWLHPLQPVADLRHPDLDLVRFLRAVLPAQLQARLLQGVRLHDNGRVRRSQSLRAVHHVVRCLRRCWGIASIPAVVGQQCCRQLRLVPCA